MRHRDSPSAVSRMFCSNGTAPSDAESFGFVVFYPLAPDLTVRLFYFVTY
jgi:hypothetical protein